MSSKPTSPKTPVATSIPAQKATIPQSTFDAMPDSGYVREAQLVQSPKRLGVPAPLPFSAPTLWRMMRQGKSCRAYKLSSRVTAFNVGEVRAWMAAQEAAHNPVVVGKNPVKRTTLVMA